jgi:hypothetical protein
MPLYVALICLHDRFMTQIRKLWIAGMLVDAENGATAARIDGVVRSGIALTQHDGQLAILDESGITVGLAEFSFIRQDSKSLRIDTPSKRGFDGYIRNFRTNASYALVLLVPAAQQAF